MFPTSIFVAALAVIGSVAAAPGPYHRSPNHIMARQVATCNGTTVLNTTTATYTVQPGDSLTAIATRFQRGLCDVARANAIADPDVLAAGQVLTIPAQVCNPDNSTCLANEANPTATCINGGPGYYTVVSGDTLTTIAEDKFNITLDALVAANKDNIPDPNLIEVGQVINVPVCAASHCLLQPYVYQNRTLVQLAREYETTIGQILAINLNFNGTRVPTTGQTIILPSRCSSFPPYQS